MAKWPTHILKVKERNGQRKCNVGVGWQNEDGSISIQLNPCVVLSSRDDVYISLFPFTPRTEEET